MRGAREAYRSLLADRPELDVSASFVFSPILPRDDRAAAERLVRELGDPRAHFYWDEERAVGRALRSPLGLDGAPFAWDVYCLWAPGVRWSNAAPPAPTHWAHQLGGGPPTQARSGRVGVTLAAWADVLSGKATAADVAEPLVLESIPLGRTLTFRAEDLRPLPETLLRAVLAEWEEEIAAGRVKAPADATAREAIAAELLRRMKSAVKGFEGDVPRAVFHEGTVLVLRGESVCVPPDD